MFKIVRSIRDKYTQAIVSNICLDLLSKFKYSIGTANISQSADNLTESNNNFICLKTNIANVINVNYNKVLVKNINSILKRKMYAYS